MIHRARCAIALTLLVVLGGRAAEAQFFYPYGAGNQGFGFGGWGQTVQGSIAAGMGSFAAGAGQYNYDTSVANSVNSDTLMRWDTYIWQSQQKLNEMRSARLVEKQGRNVQNRATIDRRLRDNPNQVDIDRGDALNVLLQTLSYPKVLGDSGLARATGRITPKMIKNIPFRYAPEMAVICIDRLRNEVPELLESGKAKPQWDTFAKAIGEGIAQIKAGDEVTKEVVDRVRSTGRALQQLVESGLPEATPLQRRDAVTYLRNLRVFLRMLKDPDFAQAYKGLDKVESTTVGNLVAFMATYNLRFGPATTTAQKATYRELYPIVRADRDKILDALGPQAAPPPGAPINPTEIFRGLDEKALAEPPQGK